MIKMYLKTMENPAASRGVWPPAFQSARERVPISREKTEHMITTFLIPIPGRGLFPYTSIMAFRIKIQTRLFSHFNNQICY